MPRRIIFRFDPRRLRASTCVISAPRRAGVKQVAGFIKTFFCRWARPNSLEAMSKREPIPEQRYVIEHGVQLPKSKREIAAVLEKMKVGDSFSIVHETTPKHVIYSTAYLLGMKVRIRARRVWRTK
jgi:hypothetical protein